MTKAFALVLAVGALALAATPAGAVCSVRGNFCGYPAWAANAFEHPTSRVNLRATYGNDYGPGWERRHRHARRHR